MEERRKAPPESPAWLAISQLRLLSDSATAPLQRILKQAVQRCGCTGGVFALVRDPGIQLRATYGTEWVGSSPESVFALARDRDEALIIDDAAADAAAKGCPEVTGEPNVRLFASVPVRAPSGAVVGLLSIFASRPRAELPEANPELLASFGHVLELYFQMRADEEHDPDTGMLGPAAFKNVIAEEWAAALESGKEVDLLLFSLPTLGRINAQHGNDAGDQVVAELAALINRKLLMNRLIIGRVSGSSVGIVMPEHSSHDLLQSAVESVRSGLLRDYKYRVPSAAAAFRFVPAAHPDLDPVVVLHAAERATALRQACRRSHFPTFEISHLRDLHASNTPPGGAAPAGGADAAAAPAEAAPDGKDAASQATKDD